jgi:hypothetical protein
LAYLRGCRLGHHVWAHDVVTSYYVNRSDQFPVALRLYFQFNLKYKQQVLEQSINRHTPAPTLAAYRQSLATLLSYHYHHNAIKPRPSWARSWWPIAKLELIKIIELFAGFHRY